MRFIYTIVIFSFTFNASTAYSQSKLGLKINGGAGTSIIKQNSFGVSEATQQGEMSHIVYAGSYYSLKQFRFNIGLGVLGTRYRKHSPVMTVTHYDNLGAVTEPVYHTVYNFYTHLIAPATLGYVIPLNKKLSLVPELGVMPAYTLPIFIRSKNHKTEEKESLFLSRDKPFSLLALAILNIEYALTDKVNFFGGVSCTQMLSNRIEQRGNDLVNNPYKYEHAYMINIGIVYKK